MNSYEIEREFITMKRYVFTLLCLIGSMSIFSQSKQVKLTLEDMITIASDSSLQAFTAQNLYQKSYWEFVTFKAGRLPSLTLKMTPFEYYRDITRRYDSESNIDVYRRQQSLYSSGNLSVSQNFDLTGGTFFIDSKLEFIRNLGTQTYSQFNTVPIRVGYSQSLFGFNSFKWDKKIEPLKYEKAKMKYLYDRETISESSIAYFFSLAMAQMEYDMAKENVSTSDTLYAIGEEKHKIAAISHVDLTTLKLDAINAKNTLKNAEISLKRAMSDFVSFLNMEKGTQIELELPDRPADLVINEEIALLFARNNNPDFLTHKQEILEAERETERTKKSSVFDASFYASIGFNQVADQFADAYRNPLQQDIVSIGFSIPLIDWGVRKGKANMARNNLNVQRISVQQKEINLGQDVIMTVSDFNMQQNMINSAEEAVELSNEAYYNTRERFIIGKADINSLTLSLNRQKEAQKNYISILHNYWKSYYKIRKFTLFDFNKGEGLDVRFDKEKIQ